MGMLAENYHFHTRWRAECGEQHGTVFDLPVVKPIKEIRRLIREQSLDVLDFGAGEAKSGIKIYQVNENKYWTLDSDATSESDYQTLSDIPKERRFGIVILDQVIEHIEVTGCYQIIQKLREVLEPGGFISITIPNVSHPVRYWADCDHVTPWSFYDVYGLLRNCDLEVKKIGRFNKRNLGVNPLNYVFAAQMRRIYRMDWCDSVWVLGQIEH